MYLQPGAKEPTSGLSGCRPSAPPQWRFVLPSCAISDSSLPDTIAISRALRMDSRNSTYHHMRMGLQPRVRKCRHAGIWTASNKLEHGDYRTCHFRHLAIATWATNSGARLSATIQSVRPRSIRPSRDSQRILNETSFHKCSQEHTQLHHVYRGTARLSSGRRAHVWTTCSSGEVVAFRDENNNYHQR